MIAYQVSNSVEVKVRQGLSILQGINLAYQNGLFAAGTEAVKLIKSRVQKSGVSADGKVLFTKSRAKDGAYSQRHGTARRLRNLRVSKVDLTFTGDMMKDFGIAFLRNRSVEVGFTSGKEAAKLERLEQYYGADIMAASDDEESQALDKFESELFKVIDKIFS